MLLPLSAIGTHASGAAVLSAAIIGAFVAAVVADGLLAPRSLDGIRVNAPGITRLSKDREGAIDLHIENDKTDARRLRLGLGLPKEIASAHQDIGAVLPAGINVSRLAWSCTPARRGNYTLENCYLEGASPLGFWSYRATRPIHAEIRVYPDLLRERKNLAALFLTRGGFGVHVQRQVGKGREFEKLREYIAGDSFDDIHWKATAKRGRPITKVYQIERTQEVYIIIDASRLSARAANVTTATAHTEVAPVGGIGTSILERFITAALVVGLAAERQGDMFGVVAFDDKVARFVRAKNGKAHYRSCRDALYTLQAEAVTPDFDELCSFIRLKLSRRALLVFLTSLDDPVLAESFVRNLELICRNHLVLVNMLKPARAMPLFHDANVGTLDDLYGKLGGHIVWHNLRELEKVLRRRGVGFSLLDSAEMCAQLVSQYVSVKRRQIL
jgi:uncharacterized protein (DUF58 family)